MSRVSPAHYGISPVRRDVGNLLFQPGQGMETGAGCELRDGKWVDILARGDLLHALLGYIEDSGWTEVFGSRCRRSAGRITISGAVPANPHGESLLSLSILSFSSSSSVSISSPKPASKPSWNSRSGPRASSVPTTDLSRSKSR